MFEDLSYIRHADTHTLLGWPLWLPCLTVRPSTWCFWDGPPWYLQVRPSRWLKTCCFLPQIHGKQHEKKRVQLPNLREIACKHLTPSLWHHGFLGLESGGPGKVQLGPTWLFQTFWGGSPFSTLSTWEYSFCSFFHCFDNWLHPTLFSMACPQDSHAQVVKDLAISLRNSWQRDL